MERTESKSIRIHPAQEESMVALMQRFGWNLLSSQEVKTKDSHLESIDGKLYSVTESEHYVKLTFSRSLSLPGLQQIRALENEYFSLIDPTDGSVGGPIFIAIIALVIGFAVGSGTAVLISLGIGGIAIAIGVSNYNGNQKKANMRKYISQRKEEILSAVDEILNN